MREASFAPISLSEIDVHIDDDSNLIIIDFAESRALPLDADIDEVADGDVTVQRDISLLIHRAEYSHSGRMRM